LADGRQRLGDLCAGGRKFLLARVVFLTALGRGPEQLLCPIEVNLCQRQRRFGLVESGNPIMQKSDLVFEALDGALQFPAPAPGFGFDSPHAGDGRLQIRVRRIDRRFLLRDGDLKGFLVDLREKVAFVQAIVVIDQNTGNLSAYARCDERYVPVDIGVVRRNGGESEPDPRDAKRAGQDQNHDNRADQQPSPSR
jgi:hypothetical protein